MVELPSLVLYCSRMSEDHEDQAQWNKRLPSLIHTASTMSRDVKSWITAEAEPLFLSHASSQRTNQGYLQYPEIISAVLDCVANSTLLTLGKILSFLCHSRLRWSTLPEQAEQYELECSELLDAAETMEQRRQRVITAFDFVQKKSYLAARPLEFGLRSVNSSGVIDSIDLLDNLEAYVKFGHCGSHCVKVYTQLGQYSMNGL